MPSNLQPHLNKIAQLVDRIQHLDSSKTTVEICSTSLYQFETIALPLELVETGIRLWEAIFSPEVLRSLSVKDPDTLEAWAIALSQTLQTQLAILQNWNRDFNALPIPPALTEKIRDRIDRLDRTIAEKSELLQAATTLLDRESQLRQDGEQLQQLKQTATELEAIQTELETTDLEELRQAIADRERAIAPQRHQLESFKQQKAECDREVAALQHQQTLLENELKYLQQRRESLQPRMAKTAESLISLTIAERERLGNGLKTILSDLEEERKTKQEAEAELHQAIADFNQYQKQTQEVIDILETHYQRDRELGKRLPVNRQKVESLMKTIQESLVELDEELAAAVRENERSQAKISLTF